MELIQRQLKQLEVGFCPITKQLQNSCIFCRWQFLCAWCGIHRAQASSAQVARRERPLDGESGRGLGRMGGSSLAGKNRQCVGPAEVQATLHMSVGVCFDTCSFSVSNLAEAMPRTSFENAKMSWRQVLPHHDVLQESGHAFLCPAVSWKPAVGSILCRTAKAARETADAAERRGAQKEQQPCQEVSFEGHFRPLQCLRSSHQWLQKENERLKALFLTLTVTPPGLANEN